MSSFLSTNFSLRWSPLSSIANDSGRPPSFLANGVDIDSVDAIEQMENYNLSYKEGVVKSQNALANGIDIDSVEAIEQMEQTAYRAGAVNDVAASVGEYADVYGRSYKEFANSSFMQGLAAGEGFRFVKNRSFLTVLYRYTI
jgi:hypothetical protein